jgi:ribosomal protein S18 acetylase RimI-like enzyme
MTEDDLESVAHVHSKVFTWQSCSHEWISCNYRAFPRIQYFVAEEEGVAIGYIQWIQKSGFRPEVVLELEQIAVLPDRQGKGIGRRLISESLPMVEKNVALKGARIRHVLVTTRADNQAQRLYQMVLGANAEAKIPRLYSANEVVMISRDVDIEIISQKYVHNSR